MEPPSRTPPGPPAQRGKGRATAKCRRLRKGSGDTVRFRCCYEISGSCRDLADGHGRFARAPRPDSPRVRHKSLTWNTSPCRARPLTGPAPDLLHPEVQGRRTMEGSSNQKTLLTPTQWGKLSQIHIDCT